MATRPRFISRHRSFGTSVDGQGTLHVRGSISDVESKLSMSDNQKTKRVIIHLNPERGGQLNLDALGDFTNLELFGIVGGCVERLDLAPLARCQRLKEVSINSMSSLRYLDLTPLFSIPTLERIDIDSIESLETVKMDNIGKCKHLKELTIECEQVDFDLELIRSCRSLHSLNIKRGRTIDLSPLARLKNLHSLRINTYGDDSFVAYERDVIDIDCAPLLSLPNMMYLYLKQDRAMFPDFVEYIVEDKWHGIIIDSKQVTDFYRTITPDDWRNWSIARTKLERYAQSIASRYWRGLNTYILGSFGIHEPTIANAVIPSDVMALIFDTDDPFNPEVIKTRIEKHIPEMVTRYLNGRHSTRGINLDRLMDLGLYTLVPGIIKKRKREIRDLTFYGYPDRYYLSPLINTAYGEMVLNTLHFEERDIIAMEHLFISKDELEEIRSILREQGIETNWKYVQASEQ